jgi:hypothetical protein
VSYGKSLRGPAAGESVPLESATIVMGNTSPQILSEPPGLGPGGSFSLENGPEGMTLDDQIGVAEWQPTARNAGDPTVVIAVRDGQGGEARQSFSVSVNVGGAPAAPADD